MRIHQAVDRARMNRAWRTLFQSRDPFSVPFTNSVEHVALFFPTEGYYLSKVQLAALYAGAQELGEEYFYTSMVEGGENLFASEWSLDAARHWECRFPDYEEYRQLDIFLENALYSCTGCWGVIVSHEDHAVVGGSEGFMLRVCSAYPEWESDVQQLQRAWLGNPNNGWLRKVMPAVQRTRAFVKRRQPEGP